MSRHWPIPDPAKTLHCIGDIHIGANPGTEFNLERRAIVVNDLLNSSCVPIIDHHLQLGDLTNTATQDTEAMAWMSSLGGTKHHVIGNHDIWDVRTKQQCATAWGLASADYVTDLGYALLVVIGPDAINPSNLTDLSFNSTTLNWLDAQLSAATKPVLIGAHPPLMNTVGIGGIADQYKSDNIPFSAQPDSDIRAVLASHSIPKAWISGHTHTPIDQPYLVKDETVGSNKVAAINTSCLAYTGMTREWTDRLVTMFVTVDDSSITVRFRDHGARQWIGAGPDEIRAWGVTF